MIWIATLSLLCVSAWLLLSALNEKKWVDAHLQDEAVAADPGFLPDLSAAAKKLSLEDENAPLARAVTRAQDGSARLGKRLGTLAQAAKVDPAEAEATRYTGRTGADYLNEAANRAGIRPNEISQKVKTAAAEKLDNHKGKEGIVGRVADGVTAWIDKNGTSSSR